MKNRVHLNLFDFQKKIITTKKELRKYHFTISFSTDHKFLSLFAIVSGISNLNFMNNNFMY